MTWQDRLNQAAYTSPSGVRMVFDYEDVSVEFDRQTVAYNFPMGRGTYVQDLGNSSRRFPLRLFFSGDNYDQESDNFEVLLREYGVGILEHPIYGLRYVVPFGTVSRRDDLKTAANQAVFEVAFFETVRSVYPATDTDGEAEVLKAVDEYNAAAAEAFDGSIDLSQAGSKARLKDTVLGIKNAVVNGLQAVADTVDAVSATFNTIDQSINSGIDLLVAKPLDLAFQIVQLVQAPARSSADISARLAAYGNLLNSIINDQSAATPNEFRSRDLYGSSYVTGSITASLYTDFRTKSQALEAVDAVFNQFDAFVAWRDAKFEEQGVVDTGEALQTLQEAVALMAGYLIGISFTLKQERAIVLDRDRTIIDLCFELFGSLDDLDFLITSNDLTGSQLIELPRGSTIVYYL